MRIGLYALAAAAVLAVTVPATAQEFRFRAGEDGVGVRIGRDHDSWRARDEWREHRAWGRNDRGCRTVIVKHRTPSGNLIIRKTRRCGGDWD